VVEARQSSLRGDSVPASRYVWCQRLCGRGPSCPLPPPGCVVVLPCEHGLRSAQTVVLARVTLSPLIGAGLAHEAGRAPSTALH
jgi:hypothetical protein